MPWLRIERNERRNGRYDVLTLSMQRGEGCSLASPHFFRTRGSPMKFRFFPSTALLMAVCASAQVASHAPTSFPSTTLQAPSDINKPVVRVNGSLLTNADLTREEYAIF